MPLQPYIPLAARTVSIVAGEERAGESAAEPDVVAIWSRSQGGGLLGLGLPGSFSSRCVYRGMRAKVKRMMVI